MDGIRGIAVLLVFLSHLSLNGMNLIPGISFAGAGKYGVYLFFLLSAYLLDQQIARALRNQKANGKYWANYALRRILRIYPLFSLTLLLNFLLFTYTDAWFPIEISAKDIVTHLALLDGERIYWSIPAEFKYYLISPLIMLVFHHLFKWNRLGILFLIIALCLLSKWVIDHYALNRTATVIYLPIFLTGTLISIFELLHRDKFTVFFKKHSLAAEVTAFICFVGILLLIPPFFNKTWGTDLPAKFFHSWDFFLPISLAWGILLITGKNTRGILNKVLAFKPLRFLGTISFSLYLIHLPVIRLIEPVGFPKWLASPFALLFALVLSTITYMLIEYPFAGVRLISKTKI